MQSPVFKRKIYSQMLDWKASRNGSTALLIKGARRVGKSTVAEEFARREYKSYLIIDFAEAGSDIHSLFDDVRNLDYLFLQLQALYNVQLHQRESVIIFDEIQKCPKARQAIKYLVKDGRYDYIETGSLMSLRKYKRGIMIPSEETRISMYPMDYEEFLWAIGDAVTFPMMRAAYDSRKPLGDAVHRQFMRKFRLYMLVGGMPQAVNTYISTNNLLLVDAKKREIIELYIDDLREIDETGRASRIFQSIPGELSRSKLRFSVGSVIENADAYNLDSIWQDLENSLTVNFSYRCTDPNAGLGLHKDYSSFKLFLGDTGLFVSLAFWDKDTGENIIYQKLLSDKLSADLGMVYENVVAQSLRANGHSLYYYTFKADSEGKNHYEIDFLTTRHNKLEPIEVKSSGYTTHKSLTEFCRIYSARVGRQIMLYPKDLKQDGQTLYLPVYMVTLL
ncbi:MAG: ATP-binding protein [Bacteroidales bacterium]|nr:ATP-binding protein [Bacteroidales bacterium]